MSLGSEQGLQEEGIQQGALWVTLPDAPLHVDRLCEPVCGGDVQSGRRVEEQQEVNEHRRHGEVA